MMDPVIDCHIHLWREGDGQPIWVRQKIRALPRTASLDDLAGCAWPSLEGVVVVQAAECVAETEVLLAQAVHEPRILGVVGWVDLTAPDVGETLDGLARSPAFKGVRVQAVFAGPRDWAADRAFIAGLRALAVRGLVLDLLVAPAQLELPSALQDAVPELSIMLNHGGRPVVMADDLSVWRAGMARVACETRASVKLSGLVERAGFEWSTERLAPVVDTLIETMGPERLAFASNWPMLDLLGSWRGWADALALLLERRGAEPAARRAIWSGTARRVYGLPGTAPATGTLT